MLATIEATFLEAAAGFFQQHELLASVVVVIAETNFAKALPFAPFLMVAWFSKMGSVRERVLTTFVSCALALIITWCFTSTWIRPRPISPSSGLETTNRVFMPTFIGNATYMKWGCFPSDHAAYLTALGLGLLNLRISVGITCLLVAVVGNGLARMLVGLHYPSDIVIGILIGVLAHGALFRLVRLDRRDVTRSVALLIDKFPILQAGLILIVVEMSTLFRDLRFLERLLFG